jgi:decaprenylphospho-beta-D-ribofuranose 2-oxidase
LKQKATNQKYYILAISIFVLLYVILFTYSYSQKKVQDELLISDVSRLFPVQVQEIIHSDQESGLINAVVKAAENNLKISIAGARHSQGGHAFYQDALLLDMRDFNEILSFNEKEKTITVQSGATWEDVQNYINPYNLSVKVMQSSNIFTIGGSLSANAHGRDIHYGPIIETVNSFRLLLADGSIIEVSREKNKELFQLVIGGYGLFGVILDVELQLTDNILYEEKTEFMDYKQYATYFKDNIMDQPSMGLHIARLSVAPNSFLTEMYATTYLETDETRNSSIEDYVELITEEYVVRNKFIFGLSRKYDWGKNRLWDLQKVIYDPEKSLIISRNNAMRPAIEFLDYYSQKDTDILQEYFIPIDLFTSFVDDLREVMLEEDVNLINITVRYVPKSEEAFLSYAQDDMFALVLLINQGLSPKELEKAERFTQQIIDMALEHDGTYYLTYQLYPSNEQMKRAYPNTDEFFQKKLYYDPDQRFMNKFYERYGIHEKEK